jgi:hypothetical protein
VPKLDKPNFGHFDQFWWQFGWVPKFGLVPILVGHLISFWRPQLAKYRITNLVAKIWLLAKVANFLANPAAHTFPRKTFGSSRVLMLSYSGFRIKRIVSQEAEMSWYHQLALYFQLQVKQKSLRSSNENFEKLHHHGCNFRTTRASRLW